MNIFEYATKNKFRFPSEIGEITTEQLWDLPLVVGSKGRTVSLDTVAKAVNSQLKGVTEESFVATKVSPQKTVLEKKLEVVKHIIAYKLDLEAKATEAAAKATKRSKLLSILEQKEDDELKGMSREEIIKELNNT